MYPLNGFITFVLLNEVDNLVPVGVIGGLN